jgi:hypothetical protein
VNFSEYDLDLFNVHVDWIKNGVVALNVNYPDVSEGGIFNSVLNSGNISKGEKWSCAVQLSKEGIFSEVVSSENLSVLNSPPVVNLISPLNDSSTINRTPLFIWNGEDSDGDNLVYEVEILPYYGGEQSSLEGVSVWNIQGESYSPASDLKYLFDNGYHYVWKVRAFDGEEDGSWSEERILKIDSYVGVNLVESVSNFGFRNVSDYPVFSGNTSEGDANPFVLENIGNSVINVSLGASPLFRSIQEDSDFYQFKISNHAGHFDAFNLLSSLIEWTKMPVTGNVVGISELKYGERGMADIDLYIRVPGSEPPGTRNSTVTFTANLAE